MATVTRKWSSVWNYFQYLLMMKQRQFAWSVKRKWRVMAPKLKSFSTFNMQKHLRTHHPDKLKELVESEKAAAKSQASSVTSSLQVTIEECLEKLQLSLMTILPLKRLPS